MTDQPLEVGAVYLFKSGDEGKATYFTVFEYLGDDRYTVWTHDRNQQTSWNLRDWYGDVTKLT